MRPLGRSLKVLSQRIIKFRLGYNRFVLLQDHKCEDVPTNFVQKVNWRSGQCASSVGNSSDTSDYLTQQLEI